MGNASSTPDSPPLTSTPLTSTSSLFPLPVPASKLRRQSTHPPPPSAVPQRRSFFPPDENEPDDLIPVTSPHENILLGWTRTEAGLIIPQIRNIPLTTPLDDTIFNSPRLPWVHVGEGIGGRVRGTRSRSPVGSVTSIPRMRQFSIESLRSVPRRELRVVNTSSPPERSRLVEQEIESDFEEMEEEESRCQSVEDCEKDAEGWREDGLHSPIQFASGEEEEGEATGNVDLRRGNSTNDSGYSSYHPDSDTASDDEILEGWQEAAGYTTTTTQKQFSKATISHISLDPSQDAIHYLHSERQESSYISNLLRSHPFDEWSEWGMSVTKLLRIPEEEPLTTETTGPHTPPQTPTAQNATAETQKSPSRRRSLFNFAKLREKTPLLKRKSVLW